MTPEEGLQKQIEVYRRMQPHERLRIGFELYDLARTLARAGVRHQHPDWDDRQVEDEVARRFRLAQQEFLEDLVTRLERTGIVYAITGSIASNLWGMARLTHDVDVLVVLSADQVANVVALFSDRYYVSAQAATEAVSRGGMFNIVDTSVGFKADIWVSLGDSFSQSMLSRRRRVEVVPGVITYVASPEDVLLHKLVWNTITPSERQLADAAGIAAVQAGNLDLTYMRKWAARQSTGELLETVLQGKYLKRS